MFNQRKSAIASFARQIARWERRVAELDPIPRDTPQRKRAWTLAQNKLRYARRMKLEWEAMAENFPYNSKSEKTPLKNPRGAGRKPIGDKPRRQVRLSLDESAIAQLKAIGDGNMSEAVHILLGERAAHASCTALTPR